MKTSSELLTEESYVYVNTVIILGASLGVFTLCGLLWHYCFYKRTLSPKSSESGIRWWNYTDFILRDLFCRNMRKDYSPSIAPRVSWNLRCHNIFFPFVPHFWEVNMIPSVFHWPLEIWKAVCHFKLSLLLTKRRCSCTLAVIYPTCKKIPWHSPARGILLIGSQIRMEKQWWWSPVPSDFNFMSFPCQPKT